ncbi:MAG: hypothetical protein RLZZ603_781 [Actinomycetota bacterium]
MPSLLEEERSLVLTEAPEAISAPRDLGNSYAQRVMNESARMIEQVSASPELGPQLQVYTPPKTVAFSRRETFLYGFDRAVIAAKQQGYEPVIRTSGGRAVAYDEQSLVFDLVVPEPQVRFNSEFIFREFGQMLVSTMRSIGVDARLGDVPGEYCPGRYSINAHGTKKLIGTSQRAARGARLISGVLLLSNTETVAKVLTDVNAALNFDWNPSTVYSLEDELGSVNFGEIRRQLTHELRIFGEHLFRKDYI